MRAKRKKSPDPTGVPSPRRRPHELQPEANLRAFIGAFLRQFIVADGEAVHVRLIARELADPTDALDVVIHEGFQPQVRYLLDLVRSLAGDGADEPTIRRCVGSILGQCFYYYYARAVVLATELEKDLGPKTVDELVEHVCRFSLAAIRGSGRPGANSEKG